MHTFKLLAVVFFGILSMNAYAYSCKEMPDHNEIWIDGMEDLRPDRACAGQLNAILDKPVVFYFQSPGGYIDHIEGFVDGMKMLFAMARRHSKALPTMVVHNECQSACIPILSGFNQLAKENLIALYIHPETVIGFHGCSDEYAEEPKRRFTVEGTLRYLGFLEKLGGNPLWIEAHKDLFATPTITAFLPADRILADSGILDAAIIGIWH
jgi:hypothetical protein